MQICDMSYSVRIFHGIILHLMFSSEPMLSSECHVTLMKDGLHAKGHAV